MCRRPRHAHTTAAPGGGKDRPPGGGPRRGFTPATEAGWGLGTGRAVRRWGCTANHAGHNCRHAKPGADPEHNQRLHAVGSATNKRGTGLVRTMTAISQSPRPKSAVASRFAVSSSTIKHSFGRYDL